jgi:hypothetical protein
LVIRFLSKCIIIDMLVPKLDDWLVVSALDETYGNLNTHTGFPCFSHDLTPAMSSQIAENMD